MTKDARKKLPARAAHFPAALLALLLTLCLLITLWSLGAIRLLTSASLHEKVALSNDSVDRQMNRIAEDVTHLAEENSFSPEPLLALIQREDVEEFDREIVRWWTGTATTGKLAEEPTFRLEGGEAALQADDAFLATLDPLMVKAAVSRVLSQVEDAVAKSAVLFRDLLLQIGIRFVGKNVNLPQIVSLLGRAPLLSGLASLLLAGLIALLLSRRIQTAGQYIGGALSACGLLSLLIWGLLKLLDIRGMLAETSPALEAQWVHLSRYLTLEILGASLLLLALGGLLLFLARKEYRS